MTNSNSISVQCSEKKGQENIYPKVSIIMPTYNRANYIIETIKSVQSQTYQNWELIVIDDGSTDDTKEKLAQIKDDRIEFHKEDHIGMSGKIRNIGIGKAKGELIAFADSDDLWASTKLEKQINAFQQYPDAAFCLTGGYNFRKLNEPLDFFYKQKEGIKYGDLFIPFFKSEVAATTPTLIVKAKCLEITGTYNETKPLSHVDFILSFAKQFKGIILYEPLFYRRLHSSNYSSINWIKRHYDGLEMIRYYKDSLPHKLFADSMFRSCINFGERCLTHKQRRMAITQFLLAWKHKPFSIVPLKKTGKLVLQLLK